MIMRAGALDTPVELQFLATGTVDTRTGRALQNWQPLDVAAGSPTTAQYIWAQFEDVRPSRQESVVQGLEVGRRLAKVTIRYRDDVTSAMRIIRRDGSDSVWSIIGGPAMVGRRAFTELLVETTTVEAAA